MKYKGYQGTVTYDDEAKIFYGEVVGLKDVITFQGTTVDELDQAFKDSIDDYLEFCKKKGRDPEKPFSGNLMLRLPPKIHEEATIEAKYRGISLNSFLTEIISKEVHQKKTSLRKRTS
jgi:predicted HicB family RNase H-like nuclease